MLDYLPELLKGLHTSLTLTVASIIVALILSLILTIILTLKTPGLVWIVRGYITLFTCIGNSRQQAFFAVVFVCCYKSSGICQCFYISAGCRVGILRRHTFAAFLQNKFLWTHGFYCWICSVNCCILFM